MERYTLVFFYFQGGGLYILGTATLTNTNVYQNEANYVRACFLNRHPSPRWNVTRSLSWQGGGVYVYSGGEATLTNSNVYQNEADYVRSLFEPSSSAPLERYVCSWLAGGRGALNQWHFHGNADQHQRVPK